MQLTMFSTGRNPMKQPIPQVANPVIAVDVPQPRKPRMLIMADTRKNVFAVCNSEGILCQFLIIKVNFKTIRVKFLFVGF